MCMYMCVYVFICTYLYMYIYIYIIPVCIRCWERSSRQHVSSFAHAFVGLLIAVWRKV